MTHCLQTRRQHVSSHASFIFLGCVNGSGRAKKGCDRSLHRKASVVGKTNPTSLLRHLCLEMLPPWRGPPCRVAGICSLSLDSAIGQISQRDMFGGGGGGGGGRGGGRGGYLVYLIRQQAFNLIIFHPRLPHWIHIHIIVCLPL